LPTTAARPTIKILYGECDEQVLAAQAAEMKSSGHHLTTAVGRHAVQEALRRDAFDLVLLGSTLTKDDRHHLPYLVKKAHPGTKVLVMHAGTHHHEVDGVMDANASMQFVLEKISRLLAEQAVSA
jgi:DNA-binding NtrC family response regulator